MTLTAPTSAPVAACEFTLTPAEVADFYRASVRHARAPQARRIFWIQVVIGFVAVLVTGPVGVLFAPAGTSRLQASHISLLGGATALVAAGLLFWVAAWIFRRAPAGWNDPSIIKRSLALYAEGIRVDSLFTQGFYPWAEVSLIALYDRLLVFWLPTRSGFPLPASAVGGPEKLREVYATALALWRAARSPAQAS